MVGRVKSVKEKNSFPYDVSTDNKHVLRLAVKLQVFYDKFKKGFIGK